MEQGTKVYKAYFTDFDDRVSHWIMAGVVSGLVQDGVPLVQYAGTFQPLTDQWHATKAGAQRDIHRGLIRHIGRMQAKADELADEILHAELTTDEAAA